MDEYGPAAIESLIQINLEDVLSAFGVVNVRRGRSLLEWPFRSPARKFARMILDYDRDVSLNGLRPGSSRFLDTLSICLVTLGQECIPSAGPVLILSNHPGMTDTVALFASIPRSDIRIVAAERPFLKAMAATDRQLISVPEDPERRLGVLRAVSAHLRANGTILTFPAGQIEPDPQVLPGAVQSLEKWVSSIGLFVRLNPETMIVPAVVSGVLAPQATFHPLTYLRRDHLDRERLGATLQLMVMVLFPHLWPVTVTVRFAPPTPAADLIPLHDPEAITQAFLEGYRPFMAQAVKK